MTNRLAAFLSVLAIVLAIAPAASAATLMAQGCVINILRFCDPLGNPMTGETPDLILSLGDRSDVRSNNAFLHVYGNSSTTEFGSASEGHNTFQSTGIFTLTDTVTTPSVFRFTIQPGELMASASNLSDFLPGAAVIATLEIDLILRRPGVNDDLLFHTARSLEVFGGTGFNPHARIFEGPIGGGPGGVDIGYVPDHSNNTTDFVGLSFGSFTDQLFVPAAGQLVYTIETSATGDVTFSANTVETIEGMAIARTGDPNGPFTPPGGIFPVPEPSTWAMMLIGFAGLGLVGYRASRQTTRAAA